MSAGEATPAGVEHRFGAYGGQYVPETLMPALAELERTWCEARGDSGYRDELGVLLRDYVGRPSPLYLAPRLSEAAGREVWLKREDLNHTGSHKINNALGQALLCRRMGKRRVIAETGAGQHGVASATACALLDLECVVYMGAEDVRRQRAQRAADAHARRRGRQRRGRRADPQGGGQRGDPRLGDQRRDQPLHHRLGGGAGALSGDGARPSAGHRRRGARPDPRAPRTGFPTACSPASAVARTPSAPSPASSTTPASALVGVEAAGEGIDSGRHGAPLTAGGPAGVLHGALSAIMQDGEGQILEAHSVSAGLDYPGTGPEHAHLRDSGRARYVAVTDAQALAAFTEVARLEGIVPALETAHALHYVLHEPSDSSLDLVCLSGRGDKDLAEVLALR